MAIEVEKLHISLTASTNDYRKNIEDAVSVTDALVNKVKMAMRSLNQFSGNFDIEIDTKESKESLDELERQLEDIHTKIKEKTRQVKEAYKGIAVSLRSKNFTGPEPAWHTQKTYDALIKQRDKLIQQAVKLEEKLDKLNQQETKSAPTGAEKSAVTALSKQMDSLIVKLTTFNEKLATGKTTISEMVTDVRELSKLFGEAATSAQAISKARINAKSLHQPTETPKVETPQALPPPPPPPQTTYEPVKQKHVSMIDRARKAMDKLAHSSKKASGSFHGESFMKKLRNFTKSMIIFRGIFYVMSKLGEAMQAAANHSEKTMSALNSAKSASTNLVNSFAVILLPVLKSIAPILEAISRKIVDVANVVAQLFAALFNQKTYQKAIYSSEQWGDTTAGAMDKVAKAQKSIMGFDELNVIQKPQSASGGNDNPLAGGGLTEEMTVDNKYFEATKGIRDFISDIKDGVKRIAKIYMERIHPHVMKLVDPLKEVAKTIGEAIVGAIGYLGDFLDNGGSKGIETLIETFGDLFTLIDNVGKIIGRLDAWLKDKGINIGLSAEDMGVKFQGFANGVNNLVEGLNELFEGNFDDGLEQALDGLLGIFGGDKLVKFFDDLQMADGVLESIEVLQKIQADPDYRGSGPAGALYVALFGIKVACEIAVSALEKMKEKFDKDLAKIRLFWSNLGDGIKTTWEQVKNWVNQKFEDMKRKARETPENIKQFFVNLPGWFAQKFEEAKQRVKEKFDNMKQEASLTVADIKRPFEIIGSWFGNKFDSARAQVALKFGEMKNRAYIAWLDIQGVFGNVASWFANKFGGARDSMVNAFGSLGDALKRPLNAAIQVFNNFINRLNRLNINLPSIMGGGKLSFSIPTITPLATGTVVQPNKPFLAALGDNKREPEIVSPLSTMKQAIREVQNERGGSSSDKDISIAVYVGNDKLVDRTIKGANERALQSGKLILNV